MRVRVFAAIAVVSQLVGCASIVNGQNQSVSVEALAEAGAVVGASCKLSNNKGTWYITSPGSTLVQRSYEDLGVRCDKEPHDPGMVSVKSSTKAMAFGNILFGGVIGAGVDVATGAAYDYPTLITVVMGKSAAIGAPTPTPATPTPTPTAAAPIVSQSVAPVVAPAAPAANGVAQ